MSKTALIYQSISRDLLQSNFLYTLYLFTCVWIPIGS